jgi:hypothetical protein
MNTSMNFGYDTEPDVLPTREKTEKQERCANHIWNGCHCDVTGGVCRLCGFHTHFQNDGGR